MVEFEKRRAALAASRRAVEAKRQEALLAREIQRRHENTLKSLRRTETKRNAPERGEVQHALEKAAATAQRLDGELMDLQARLGDSFAGFARFTDPRSHIDKLSGANPILLFPLRLETRFKKDLKGKPQLWLRIYPDTCLIDTFEPSLTEQEVASARLFWARVWRAGGDEGLEREAWRELVASHGSGRAGWIVRTYLPLNPGDKPEKAEADDILLIVTSADALPVEALAYWEAAWKAAGSGAALDAAYAMLEQAVGAERARDIVDNFRPFNFTDTPGGGRTRDEVVVAAAVLRLEDADSLATRRTSWSSAAHIDLLPERFMVVGYAAGEPPMTAMGGLVRAPLAASPDPNAPAEQQLKRRAPPDDDILDIPDDIAWMFDFDKAVEAGMALRIDLTPAQAQAGFDRLVVLGVRLADSPEEGSAHLAGLLEHHLFSRAGLEILPQGTPTNNTEKGGAGYSFREEADASFAVFMRNMPAYVPESDPLRQRDGQRLADLLGLPHGLVQRMVHAGGLDQADARAMQVALWPGTLGYMMNTLLAPVFNDEDVDATRAFFSNYVSGRGPLPALRIGRQPYGILPVTAFNRIKWFGDECVYSGRLYQLLKRADAEWKTLADQVSHIGKSGDPHQILLDVLGLHPSSVEYYPQQAESVEHKFHEMSFLDFPMALDFLNLFPAAIPLALLRSYGYAGEQIPELLSKVYKARQTPLGGPVIDDVPLSESALIRAYAGDGNYIAWLADAARDGIEALQREQGFNRGRKPTALLYLLLRNALQLGFHESGVRLGMKAGVLQDAVSARREPAFVHVKAAQERSESRYGRLFAPEARITGSQFQRLGDYIARNIQSVAPELHEQILALDHLAAVPTARLERAFAEHIDCCSYRLDAWKTGLCTQQLERMRQPERQATKPGLHLGAFGWIEPLRPEKKQLEPVHLRPDLDSHVNKRDGTPLYRDAGNLGLIHAPSINHATTAAVLRNGYQAHDGQLAVDLSSRRVRKALAILEGIRNGQSLGALLGYQFERYLHDHGPLQVRSLIYPLRRAFPLVANQIAGTGTETGPAKESIAAMNVVDGRKLVEHAERESNFVYPFGLGALPRPNPDAGQEAAVTAALAHIRDINDAVADLALAEGVHQAVVGNYERAASTLDAFAKGNYPPEPDVIRTPRSGAALTLRTAIHLPYIEPPTVAEPLPPNPLPAIAELTTLSIAEPAINAWLAGRLPDPVRVGCNVTYTDRGTDSEITEFIDQTQLGFQPIDLLYRAGGGTAQMQGDLDDRILQFVQTNRAPRHDRQIVLRHTERVDGRYTWFELQALLSSLRSLLVGARPLRPADLMRANDAKSEQQALVTLPPARLEYARNGLSARLSALVATNAVIADPGTAIDLALDLYVESVSRLAAYRLPQTGTGFAYDWRGGVYAAVGAKVQQRVAAWNRRLAKFDAALGDYDMVAGGLDEGERIARLQAAELIVATALSPTATDADSYRAGLTIRRGEFVVLLNAMQAFVDTAHPTVAVRLAQAKTLGPLAAFDHDELDFAAEDADVERFRSQLGDAVVQIEADVLKRIASVDALLDRYPSAPDGQGQVKLLQEAAKLLFGEDFQLVPQVFLPESALDELVNAWQHTMSGKLTEFLMTESQRDFPVDDWLHGVARVRDKLRQWENLSLLSDAFGAAAPAELVPLQLPFVSDDPWLALEFPEGHVIDSDRLLYTANFAQPFDRTKPVCGLLVDEWTEVVPGTQETTGIAFHYDRPNSEPPQAWLLALPTDSRGAWSWDDLLDAVNDTLDSARQRAVEPSHLDKTAYSWFLPATMSAYTFPEISISNNLLRNVQVVGAAANVAAKNGMSPT